MPSRIFVNSNQSWQIGEGLLLSKEQKHHLQKVLRLRDKDLIEVVNNFNSQTVLAELSENQSTAIITSELPANVKNYQLNLIFAYCKSTKNETIIEKCTELGVDNFVIYQARHSVAKVSEQKVERLLKIAESASCQSKRSTIPNIQLANSQIKLVESLNNLISKDALSLIASLEGETIKMPNQTNTYKQINLAIGPEGDFSKEEYQSFKSLGFIPISLGQNILRAETAAIALTSFININSRC